MLQSVETKIKRAESTAETYGRGENGVGHMQKTVREMKITNTQGKPSRKQDNAVK